MYLCILDQAGEVLLHKNFRANPDAFFKAVANYREDLVVAVECIFTWYWLADLWSSKGIHFVLGHIENTNSQYNFPAFSKKLTYPSNRGEV